MINQICHTYSPGPANATAVRPLLSVISYRVLTYRSILHEIQWTGGCAFGRSSLTLMGPFSSSSCIRWWYWVVVQYIYNIHVYISDGWYSTNFLLPCWICWKWPINRIVSIPPLLMGWTYLHNEHKIAHWSNIINSVHPSDFKNSRVTSVFFHNLAGTYLFWVNEFLRTLAISGTVVHSGVWKPISDQCDLSVTNGMNSSWLTYNMRQCSIDMFICIDGLTGTELPPVLCCGAIYQTWVWATSSKKKITHNWRTRTHTFYIPCIV